MIHPPPPRSRSIFHPPPPRLSMGLMRFGRSGRFEVYSIVIQKLAPNRGLGKIWLKSEPEKQILYEPVDKEKIPIGKPLPLKGPSEPVQVHDTVTIVFGAPNHPKERDWRFRVTFDEEWDKGFRHGPQEVVVIDPKSGSRAIVRYGLHGVAVDATFELQYAGLTNIKISKCEIYATTNDDVRSKCQLLSIGSTDEPYELSDGEMIKLDRSALGVPLSHELFPLPNKPYVCFEMYLEYYELLFTRSKRAKTEKEEASTRKMRGPFKFEAPPVQFGVPDSPTISQPVVFNLGDDASLNLIVKWTDELMNLTHEMMLKPLCDSVVKAFGSLKDSKDKPYPPRFDYSYFYERVSALLAEEDVDEVFEPVEFELDYSSIDRELEDDPQLRVQVDGIFMGKG